MAHGEPGTILVATTNPGKMREFREMLGSLGVGCVSLADVPAVATPEESGATFRANACLKASAYARATGFYTLADDSGLEVDALGGKPGVDSAYWAAKNGEETPEDRSIRDPANCRVLLRQLEGVVDGERTARFVCVLALSDPSGEVLLTTRGQVEGRILRAARGSNGFGYDPLFLMGDSGQTTAEMSPEAKHAVSHRGEAARRMFELLPDFVPGLLGGGLK